MVTKQELEEMRKIKKDHDELIKRNREAQKIKDELEQDTIKGQAKKLIKGLFK